MAVLTDARARKLEAGARPIADGTIPGLYLNAGKIRGSGKWILRFVSPVSGKRRDMGLGTYPAVGISAVRRAAMEARGQIEAGQDPIEVRREAVTSAQSAASMPTFEEAARQVYRDRKDGFRNRKHTNDWLNALTRHAFPVIGHRRVDQLTSADFAAMLRPIWLTIPETASRVRQRCDVVMRWCAAHGYVMASPVAAVDHLLPKQPDKASRVVHHPAVPWRDVPAFVRDVLHSGKRSQGKLALEVTLLTALRSGVVRGMLWSEIDFENAIWSIPAERMKKHQPHRVPLGERMLEIIRGQKIYAGSQPLVFPSRNGTPQSDMTLSKILKDAKVPSDTPGRFATPHGFRSSFRDWASENGYPQNIAERALAHIIKNATEAAYHRTDLLDARRDMMNAWEAFALSYDAVATT